MSRKIYVASSWRNTHHSDVVVALKEAGHGVYDFKNPQDGKHGFSWKEVDTDWNKWTPHTFLRKLGNSKIAHEGFQSDKNALDWCDTCVLVLPCGRSAHLELGYCTGQGKETFVLMYPEGFEPELMYLLNTNCYATLDELLRRLRV